MVRDRGHPRQFALPFRALGGYIAPPGEHDDGSRAKKWIADERTRAAMQSAKRVEDFQARIAALGSLPREKLADAVFMLLDGNAAGR